MKKEKIIPVDLDSAIKNLESNLDKKGIKFFMDTKEDEIIGELHFGWGRNLRNEWRLWEKESSLSKYFKKMGIIHADDMSGIITLSFWRHLHKQDLKLDEQVKYYKDYWEKEGK